MLRRACNDAANWPEDLRVHVNISARHLAEEGFSDLVAAALGGAELIPLVQQLDFDLLPDCHATGNGFGRLFDPIGGQGVLLTPPTQLQPEDFDRLHNINWQFTLQFPDDFQEGTAWGTVFNNFGAFLTYNAQSGTPFTVLGASTTNAVFAQPSRVLLTTAKVNTQLNNEHGLMVPQGPVSEAAPPGLVPTR